MLKKYSYFLSVSLGLISSFNCFSSTDNTFQITQTGRAAFTIRTTISNHTYQNASILVLPLNATISNSADYKPSPSGGYLFSVSDTAPVTFSISGFDGPLNIRLCLNGLSSTPISCEKFSDIAVINQHAAVGSVTSNLLNTLIPFAYTSQTLGNSWSTPVFMSTSVDANVISDVNLATMSCSSDGLNCVTGGSFTDALNDDAMTPLVYTSTDGGNSWSNPIPLAIPDVAPSTTSLTQLTGMFCSTNGRRCIALGQTTVQVTESEQNTRALSYISTNGGATWSEPQMLYKPEAYFTNVIFNLSCDNNTINCTGAGYGQKAANEWVPLTYRTTNGGVSWSGPVELPLASGTYSILSDISCSDTSLICNAVGRIQTGSGSQPTTPVVYRTTDGGTSTTSWTQTILETATGIKTSRVGSIACGASGLNCSTVGNATDDIDVNSGLVYFTRDGGSTWSSPIQTTAPDDTTNNLLNGVTCSLTGTLCIAVGSANNAIGTQFIPYSHTSIDGGKTWSTPILMPTDASADAASGSYMSAVNGSK